MKFYYKNYWGESQVILAKSSQSKGLIAVGEVLKDGGERFIHIKESDLIDFMKKIKEKKE